MKKIAENVIIIQRSRKGEAYGNLTYYQDSQECNAVDDITRKLHTYVSQVKNPELEDYYMTLGQKLDRERKELIDEVTADVTGRITADVTEKITLKSMYEFLEFLLEDNKTKAESFAIIAKKYPQYEDKFTAFINEHWEKHK